MQEPALSVIVSTFNRANLLKKCLESFFVQELDKKYFEVIVIDNNSTDNTKLLVREFQKKIFNLKYCFEPNQGLSYARNRGFKEALYEHLVYVDDDAAIPEHYLNCVLNIIKEHDPDILGGPIYPYYNSSKPFWFKDEFEIRKYSENSGWSKTMSISGSNFIIKKNILMEAGMFDVRLGMKGDNMGFYEEAKIIHSYRKRIPANKQKVFYDLNCFVYHHVPASKMKIVYIIKRNFMLGMESKSIKFGVDNINKHLLKNLLFCPFRMIRMLGGEIKLRGFKKAGYVKMLMIFSKYIGAIIGDIKTMFYFLTKKEFWKVNVLKLFNRIKN